MDVAALQQLKQDLLNGNLMKHKRFLIIAGVFLSAFWTVIIVGGYFLVTHAMDDNQTNAQRSINTPSQVSLLFAGRRPSELVNSLVYLNRVKLAPAADKIYYAGDDSDARLLVVARQPGAPADEAVANVMGTVRPVTSELLGELKKEKLSKDELKAIRAQGVYLDAESVKVKRQDATVAQK